MHGHMNLQNTHGSWLSTTSAFQLQLDIKLSPPSNHHIVAHHIPLIVV